VSIIDDVRDWTGSTPDDDAIRSALDRTGQDAPKAALAILRRRRADMIANPAKWAVDGDYSQGQEKYQLEALDATIHTLEVVTGEAEPDGLPLLGQARISGPSLDR
jgi:hypothetical protein